MDSGAPPIAAVDRGLPTKTEIDPASHDSLLTEVPEGYLSTCHPGQRHQPSRLIAEYPHIAGELRTCLASLDFVQHAGQGTELVALLPDGGQPAHGNGSPAPAAPTLGDFRLLRQIGRGGMGVVYEAEQISLQRRVALKTLPFAGILDPRQLVRFKNEALAAAALQHPNIVPVYAVGVDRGVHYYAMQYITGQNLAELIRELRLKEGLESAPSAETEFHQPGASDQKLCKSEIAERRPEAVSTLLARKNSSTQHTRKERLAYCREVARIGIAVAEALAH